MKPNSKFLTALEKTAARTLPSWLHAMPRGMTAPKLPAYSRRGVLEMWRRRRATP